MNKENIADTYNEQQKAKPIQEQLKTAIQPVKKVDLNTVKEGPVQLSRIPLPKEIMKLRKKNKCAIVGFAPSWYQAPWQNTEFDIWGKGMLHLSEMAS